MGDDDIGASVGVEITADHGPADVFARGVPAVADRNPMPPGAGDHQVEGLGVSNGVDAVGEPIDVAVGDDDLVPPVPVPIDGRRAEPDQRPGACGFAPERGVVVPSPPGR